MISILAVSSGKILEAGMKEIRGKSLICCTFKMLFESNIETLVVN